MRRLKKHQGALNRILKDDRITGSRRILAELLALWIDAEGDERKTLTMVLIGTFGMKPRHIWWKEDDESITLPNTNVENGAREQLQNAFASIFSEE